MIAISTVLIAVAVSVVVTRIAALALTATGMNRQTAKFQARSAFTGVGFTTSEAEDVVRHPVRRRIIMTLMLLGNAGIITIAATLILSFARSNGSQQAWLRIGMLLAGLVALFAAANSNAVDRRLSRVIGRILGRWTDLDTSDQAQLLQLHGEYGVTELNVQRDDWVAGRTLGDLSLRDEGIVVLGIHRQDGTYVGVPKGSAIIYAGDILILYGRSSLLTGLDRRSTGGAGDREHHQAVAHQERIRGEQVGKVAESTGPEAKHRGDDRSP